jgi:heat shock protein HtpX
MARKFTRRRWRRPERMTLETPGPLRRKNLGPPDMLTLEPDLERQSSLRRARAMTAVYIATATVEGVIVGLLAHMVVLALVFVLLALVYVSALRSYGGKLLVRALRAEPARNPRLNRYAKFLAELNSIPAPDVLIVRSDRPNAFAVGISPHAVVATTGSLNIEDLTLEAIIAHEIAHLRDGDATLSSLYVGVAAAHELVGRSGALAPLLAIVSVLLLPGAFVVRALRGSWFAKDYEHRADVVAALLTRYPPGVASALRLAEGAKGPGPGAAHAFWFSPADDDRARLIEEM